MKTIVHGDILFQLTYDLTCDNGLKPFPLEEGGTLVSLRMKHTKTKEIHTFLGKITDFSISRVKFPIWEILPVGNYSATIIIHIPASGGKFTFPRMSIRVIPEGVTND